MTKHDVNAAVELKLDALHGMMKTSLMDYKSQAASFNKLANPRRVSAGHQFHHMNELELIRRIYAMLGDHLSKDHRMIPVDAPDWREHDGGPCPVAEDMLIEAKLRKGHIQTQPAGLFRWKNQNHWPGDDIIAWRPAAPQPAEPPAKWQREKEHFEKGGKIEGRKPTSVVPSIREWGAVVDPNWFSDWEYRIAPEAWRLPDAPAGRQWHRTDWTQDMLPDGWRPLLKGELIRRGDEACYPHLQKDQWQPAGDIYGTGVIDSPCCDYHFHYRTRRPLPEAPTPQSRRVPLTAAQVPPGTVLRGRAEIHSDGWCLITSCSDTGIRIWSNYGTNAAERTWQSLMDSKSQIKRPGEDWTECCTREAAPEAS